MIFRFIPLLIPLLFSSCSLLPHSSDPLAKHRAKAPVPHERAVTVRTAPVFQWKKAELDAIGASTITWMSVELKTRSETRSLTWPDDAPKAKKFQKGKTYTFELLEHGWCDNDHTISSWTPELHRVRDGNKVLYDASICKTHNTQMERRLQPIVYGLPSFRPDYVKARQSFPNAGGMVGAGCCVDTSRMWTREWVCHVCKWNEDAWNAKQRQETSNR